MGRTFKVLGGLGWTEPQQSYPGLGLRMVPSVWGANSGEQHPVLGHSRNWGGGADALVCHGSVQRLSFVVVSREPLSLFGVTGAHS